MHHDAPPMSGPQWMWMPTDAPTAWRLFSWHPQPIPLSFLLGLAAAVLYGIFWWRLRRRGEHWPVGRTIMFGLGFLSILILCGSAFNGYSMALFSVHMVQHMLLSMLTPLLLLAGRPVTLGLRALEGTRAYPVLHWILFNRLSWALTSLPIALILFLFGMYGFYFTPLFDHAMANWFGHEMMLVYYVVSGLWLYWPVLGLDPSPHEMGRPLAFIASILPTPFHSFFAVIVMQSERLIVGTFARPMPDWNVNPLKDQQLGGGLAWAFADIPGLVLVAIIAVQWVRSSKAEAEQIDRSEDESHDAELAAYNAWLASGDTER